jgi:hypothetical protein
MANKTMPAGLATCKCSTDLTTLWHHTLCASFWGVFRSDLLDLGIHGWCPSVGFSRPLGLAWGKTHMVHDQTGLFHSRLYTQTSRIEQVGVVSGP